MNVFSHRVVIQLPLSSSELANIVYMALQPETVTSQLFGSNVQLTVEENLLTIYLSSNRTATLRALINSYLRWVMMIKEVSVLFD